MVSPTPTGNWSNRIGRREGRDIGSWLILENWTRVSVAPGIGRLLGRNSRAAGGFKIELAEDKTSPAGLQLRWSRVEAWSQGTRLCCITQPDPAQRALLDRMGLVIPGRLGRPSWIRTTKL
jgi:hypothetical protein